MRHSVTGHRYTQMPQVIKANDFKQSLSTEFSSLFCEDLKPWEGMRQAYDECHTLE